MSETKHDKFIRMRDMRLEKATKAVSLLANLSSANYECSMDEAQAMVDELQKAVDEVRAAFHLNAPDLAPVAADAAPSTPATDPAQRSLWEQALASQRKGWTKIGEAIEVIDTDPAMAKKLMLEGMVE